jgi:dTDP-glucose 4,6-dehydratase
MGARILLTGGTGFFGRALLRHFLASGMASDTTLCVLSRHPDRFQSAHPDLVASDQISFIQGNIQARDSLPWDQSFTHVLHAATDSTVGPRLTPLQRFHQILDGTNNLLDLAVSVAARRFLLTSSGGIYGPQPPDLEAIPEDWTGSPPIAEPSTTYSHAKRAAEHLCALYREAHGLETVVARCFTFVGPDMPLDVHFAIGNFIRDALIADAITVAGDGTPCRTYLDQSDLAHWLWTLLLHGRDGEAYNVGSDRVISIAELAYLVRELLAPSKPVRILGESSFSVIRSRYVPSIAKIQSLHGLSVRVTLPQSILDTGRAHS